MGLDVIKKAETILALEGFVDRNRPPEEIRNELDLGYKIENQSIIIYEVRPHWVIEGEKIEQDVAKATWVEAQKCWKIFWLRANLKWQSYEPAPKVKTIEEFLEVVENDEYCCFWG